MLVVATDLLALTLLTPPGEWGRTSLSAVRSVLVCRWASVGRTRRFSRRRMHKRAMPGRLVGVSVDTRGRSAGQRREILP